MSILRIPAVKAECGYKSHASIYNNVKSGLFTAPVSIGERSVGWPEDEVKAICAARVAGLAESEIKALVIRLHEQRKERFKALMDGLDGVAMAPSEPTKTCRHLASV